MAREIALDVLINERYHLMVLISESSLIADLRSEIQSVAWEVFPKLRDKQVAVIKGGTGAILPDRYKVGQLLQNGSKVFSFSSDFKRSKNRKRKLLDSERASRKIKRKRLSKDKWPILRSNGTDRLLNCENGYPSPGQSKDRETPKDNREPVDQNEHSGELSDEIQTVGGNILQDEDRKGARIKPKPSSVISHRCDHGGSGHSNANDKDGGFDDDDDDDDGHKNDAKAERGGRRSEEKKSKGGEKQTWKDRKEDTSSYRKFDEGNSEGLAPPSEKPVIDKNFMEEVTRRHYSATSSTEVMLSASSNKDLFDLGTRHHTRKRKVNEESVSKVTEWLSASVKPLQSNVNQDGNDNNCSSPETVSVGSCDNEAHSASQRKSWRILTGKADKSDNKGKCTKTGIVRGKEQKVKTTTKSGERKEALLGENQDDNRLCSDPVSQSKKDGIEPLLAGVGSDVIDSGPQIQPLRCQIRLRKLPVGANGTKLTGRELIDRTSRDQSGDLNTPESCGMGMSPTEVTGPMTRSQHENNRRSLIAPSDMKDDVEGVSTRGEGGQAFEDALVCGEAQSRRAQRGAVVVRDMGVQTSVTSVIDSPGSEVESGVADNEGHNNKSSAHEDGVNGDDDMNDVDDDLSDDHNVDDVVTQETDFSVVESREPLTGRVRRQQKEERAEEPSDVLVSTATESSSKGKNLASQIGPKNFAAGKGDSKCRKRLLCENDDHTTTVEKRDESEDSSQKAIESPVDRRTTRSQHAAKKTILLASQCGLREDREVLAPVEGNVQSRKMTSENEELDSKGRRKTVKQMETEETRGKDVQDCSDAAKNDSDSKMANSSSNGEDVGSDMERFISKYALQFCTGKRLRSRREVKKGEASQKLDSSSKKGLKSGKETLAVGENVHEARSESKETGSIGSRRGRNLGISDDEAQEKRSDLSETKSQQNGKSSQVSDEERQSKSRELFQTETVQNPAHAQISPAGGDEHVTANEAFDSDETLKDIDTINCAPQEKVLSPSVDQESSENDSESETLRGSDVEDAMECSVSGEGHYSPVPVNQPENDEPRTVRSSSKETETSEEKQPRSASDRRNTNSPKSRVDLETSVDRTHHPRESSTAVVGSPATLKHPTEDSLQSIGKDMAAEKGKSKKLDVLHNGLKSDISGKGCEQGSANKGSLMEELAHKEDDEAGSSDSGSGTEGGKDSSVLMVDRLKLFKRGKQVTWWEERDEIEKDEDGGKSRNREENTNDQTKAKRTKVDEESYKEQPPKCTRKKVVCKIGREAKREMDGKREVLSQENERKENLGEGDKVSKDEKKNKGRNTVCDEAKTKVGQEIGMESESKTTKDNRKEKLNGKTESDFAFKETSRTVFCEKAKEKLEEEFERKATNRKNVDKTTHKRVGSELKQKERNEDISDDAKDLKRKLDDKSSCEDVIKSKQKRPRDIAKSAEEKDEGSKQNSLKSKTKGRNKKKETEISAEELVASPKLQKVQGENAEKTKDDSAFSKNSTQSAIEGAGVVVSCIVDKNGRNVKLQSSVSMKSENSKTRKKETLEAPKENVKKSKPTGSTPVDNETEYSSQDSVTSMKIEKIKKRGKQKQENSLEERNGLGFHNTQELSRQTDEEDLNHESTVSKGKRKTRKNEVMDILRDIDNELASYNTEVVRCCTDENERISCQESVVSKKGEKEKKRRKARATALNETDDDTDVDKTQVLSSESVVGREKEDNQKPAGEIRTEKAKKREPQRKKCSRKNGNELVIDDKPESEKWEGRSQELTGSINVKTAKEKTKVGRKTEEKNTEKHLSRSRSRPEKSEILEETDGQEQSTNQKSSAAGIKSTKTGKKRREKVEPDSKEKSKALSGNDSLCQNNAKEKEPSMEGSGDKTASKKKTKSGLSLMDLVEDAERESPEKKTSSNSEKRSTPKELVSQRFLETPHGFQHTTKRRKTSSSTSTVHVKRKSRSGKPEAQLQLEPLTPIERHLIAGVSLDKLLDDDSFWDS